MVGTSYGTTARGPRYLQIAEGYVRKMALDHENRIIGYEYINLGIMMDLIDAGEAMKAAMEKATGTCGRYDDAVRYINPRKE